MRKVNTHLNGVHSSERKMWFEKNGATRPEYGYSKGQATLLMKICCAGDVSLCFLLIVKTA